jgi:integrase
MQFRQLESKLNSQNGTYWAFGWIGRERVRKPLGTDKAGAADHRVDWIRRACEEGPESKYWLQLKEALPARSFQYFTGLVGYQDSPAPVKRDPTWAELRAEYMKHLERPIERGKRKGQFRSESTKARYQQTLIEFDRFVAGRNITLLNQISERTAREDFADWRIASIAEKANSKTLAARKKLPGGYVLDVSILCGVFKFAVERAYVAKNPFLSVGKPGEDAESGAQPFTRKELESLVMYAGKDLLNILVLLRTGLRRSDAVRLQWKHVNPTHVSIVAQKNGNRVRVPLANDLGILLASTRLARFGKQDPDEYHEEFVLLNPYTKKPFNQTGDTHAAGKKLYERVREIGSKAGIKVHPHRFRDTFAKECFLCGCNKDEVAAYLGDTSETVSKHYGAFDTERQDAADRKLQTGNRLLGDVDVSRVASITKPNPVVSISKRSVA